MDAALAAVVARFVDIEPQQAALAVEALSSEQAAMVVRGQQLRLRIDHRDTEAVQPP